MPAQAQLLVDRMNSSTRINFTTSWKLVTVFIGGNDLCKSCYKVGIKNFFGLDIQDDTILFYLINLNFKPELTAENYLSKVQAALDY
jgi:hypothetical protein